jgi:hypothetical protein
LSRGQAGSEMLMPAANDVLQCWPVSKRVNSSRTDAEDSTLIGPMELESKDPLWLDPWPSCFLRSSAARFLAYAKLTPSIHQNAREAPLVRDRAKVPESRQSKHSALSCCAFQDRVARGE